MSKKEMNPSSQMVFDMAKIFLDIQTSSFASGMKHAKEDAERERKLQAFADKCERDLGEKPTKSKEKERLLDNTDELLDKLATNKQISNIEYEITRRVFNKHFRVDTF